MIELVYETHATTVDNEEGRATGWLPGVLSEAGREQARALGERRRDDGIDAVFTSDLARAVETAEIAFPASDLPLFKDWRLRECNYGELNGRPVAEIDAVKPRSVENPYPGESYRQVADRMASLLDDLVAGFDGMRIVLISHAAPRWALENLLAGRPLEELVVESFDWRPGWLYRLDREQQRQG